MTFSYRLSRRLAQAHLVLFGILAMGCSDTQDPSATAEAALDSSSVQFNPDSLSISEVLASSSNCANEPSGLNTISDNNWAKIPPLYLSGGGSYGWRNFSGARVKTISDGSAPRSPSTVAEGAFPKGQQGGGAPFTVSIKFHKVKTVYMCVWTKISTNFTNNGNTGTKWGFLRTPYGTGSQALNHYFNLATTLGLNLQSIGQALNRNMNTGYNMIVHAGVWHKVEFLIIGNTKGKKDGVARIWVDNNQVLNQSNVQYFLPSQAPAFNGVAWSPTYGGGKNRVPYAMWQRVDQWYISGK